MICPTCGQQIPDPRRPKRVCSKCSARIRRHDKWIFGADGRPQHRHCEDPQNYTIEEQPKPQLALPEEESV